MRTLKLELTRWKSLFFALLIILAVSSVIGLVIVLVKAFMEGFRDTNHIVVIMGFALFFAAGWLCGQSKWWRAIRAIWHRNMMDGED